MKHYSVAEAGFVVIIRASVVQRGEGVLGVVENTQ